MGLMSRKRLENLHILTYVFDWLYFMQCLTSYFFFLYRSPSSSLCMVFYSISFKIDEIRSVNPFSYFTTWIPDCDSHSPALLDFFLCSDASICSTMAFPPLGNSDHVVVSVSSDFPSYSQQDALFHCIAYDYSCADWDALCDHLRDVPWEDIFRLSASAAATEFCKWVQVGIDAYIPH